MLKCICIFLCVSETCSQSNVAPSNQEMALGQDEEFADMLKCMLNVSNRTRSDSIYVSSIPPRWTVCSVTPSKANIQWHFHTNPPFQ